MSAPVLAPSGRSHVVGRELLARPGPGSHIVQFDEEEDFLARIPGDYLAEGLASGEAGRVIATPANRAAIAASLAERGIDLDCARRDGRLWSARQLVEAHGGAIRVESEPGEGATFTVELPRGAAEVGR